MQNLTLASQVDFTILDEEINAKEAYTDKGSLRTIIRGKRDVGVIDLTKSFIPKLEKHNLSVIPLRMTSKNSILSIVYRDKEKALRLYDIAKSKGGYLSDTTPDEAREIGRLLGYTEKSIEEYVQRRYSTKIPVLPEKTPDDYDDFSEEVKTEATKRKLNENVQFQKTKEIMNKIISMYFLFTII